MSKIIGYAAGIPIEEPVNESVIKVEDDDSEDRTAHGQDGKFVGGSGGGGSGSRSKHLGRVFGDTALAHKSYAKQGDKWLYNKDGKKDADGVARTKKHIVGADTQKAHHSSASAYDLSSKAHKSGKKEHHAAAHAAHGLAIAAHEHAAKTASHPDLAHYHTKTAAQHKKDQATHN